MKALEDSIDVCDKDRPIWLTDIRQEKKDDDFLAKQEESEYPIWWPAQITTIKRFHSKREKLFTQTEIRFSEEDEYDEKLEKFNKAKDTFYKELPNLIKQYRGKYLALVENTQYIGVDEDKLLDRVIAKHGNVPMFIGQIIPEEEEPISIMFGKIAIP